MELSIVCASSGDQSRLVRLFDWIARQRFNGNVEFEVIICVPLGKVISHVFPSYCELVYSVFRNQVAQRAIALSAAKGQYIYQIDDDVSTSDIWFLDSLLSEAQRRIEKCIIFTPIHDVNGELGNRSSRLLSKPLFNVVAKYLLNGGKDLCAYSVLRSGRAVAELSGASTTTKITWCSSHFLFSRSALVDYEPFMIDGKCGFEDVYTTSIFSEKDYKIHRSKLTLFHPEVKELSFREHIYALRSQLLFVRKRKLSLFAFYLDASMVFSFLVLRKLRRLL